VSQVRERAKGKSASTARAVPKIAAAAPSADVGPRIYNLFPPLIGSVSDWVVHLPRIAAMGFDWVYINPFHYPGFSGSLYAVKDPYRLSDLARGSAVAGDDDALLRRFTREAQRHELRVMMDLVINHSAKDSPLAQEHPEWYRRNIDGTLYSPRAADPVDPRMVTVWGDLAEFDYDSPAARASLVEYWSHYVRHYAGLGFHGFRCDAAYQVPAEAWRPLIAAGRQAVPGLTFFAETLGCTPDQVSALAAAGFDYIFNSAKWWDFRAGWLLEQYGRFRHLAPSIAFPESHDTTRLAAEVGAEGQDRIEARLKFQLLFSACFSTGVMMPVGFEHGFRRKLDVVRTRPTDWEETGLDLSAFVTAVNRMKAAVPALNTEGPQRRITAPGNPVVGLLRLSGGHPIAAGGCVITLMNPDTVQTHTIEVGPLIAETGGTFRSFTDVTPLATPIAFEPGASIALEPLEIRVFRSDRAAPAVGREVRTTAKAADADSQRALEELARNRVAIERVYPEIDGGRFPVKRVVGEVLEVWADIFADGHDKLQARVKYRTRDAIQWHEAPMAFFDNDRWIGRFPLMENTDYLYTIEAWRDLFGSWCADTVKKRDAGRDPRLELEEGRVLIEKAAARAEGRDREFLVSTLAHASSLHDRPDELAALFLAEELHETVVRCAERTHLSRYPIELRVIVDRQAALFSAWYELFPRSQSGTPARSGTFDDVIARLPYVRDMGFDVLYFPPIHPIGRTNRKGRNNSLVAGPDDPGSPYAIGSELGGHTAIHPELGTLEDCRRLVEAAHDHELEIALDFAIQCSPDHPWIKEHPEWFDWRPDGSIKFAENPPKKYEDIVNLHFYREAFPAVWYALRDVVLFWIEQGVKIFRVDNPHTKPLPFWEWMIGEVRAHHPEVIFLSEAFTRPKMMKRLAKLGFSQSYTYFTWRNTKQELTSYLTELTQEEPKEYFRPNFFTNTPDINPFMLQPGGRAAFVARATLAATLSSSYGIYSGFELCEATPVPGKEEYLDSEKYEIKVWDWNRPGNIRVHVKRLNEIRRENPALHDFRNLRFYNAFNDQILLYGKMTPSKDNAILIAVNLDPHNAQGADFEVPLWEFGLSDAASIGVEDLLSGAAFQWHGKIQRIHLDPQTNPCAIWRLTPVRTKP
jgi:starch synthase (maltosyl-transferring)